MGSIKLREALRCLCDEIGWSYAVFWRSVESESSMHLVWGDGHVVENRMEVLVHKIMAQQVHLLGEGIVGQAAATGNHQWIVTDNIHINASCSKDWAELEHQFSAGIQTITVIPLLAYGVLQLGCIQMVMENVRFVNHVKILFEQLDCVAGSLLPDMSQKALGQNSQLLNSIPVVVSKTLPDQLNITNTSVPPSDAFRPIIYPVCQQTLHVNSQSENRPLGDQRIVCNPDMRLIQSAFAHDSAPQYQYQLSPLTSGLPSDSLLFSMKYWESANRIGAESDNTKAFLISSHGPIFPDSLKYSNIPSFSRRGDTGDSANALERFSFLPDGTREASSRTYPNLSSTEVAQMLSSSDLKSSQGILVDPSPSYLFINASEPLAVAGNQKQESGLCTTCDIPSVESDINSLCNQAFLSTLQECRLSSSNAFQEDQRYDNVIPDANETNISQVKLNIKDNDESKFHHAIPIQSTSGSDLYDILGPDYNIGGPDYNIGSFSVNFDNVLVNKNDIRTHELAADKSTCMAQLDVCPISHSLDHSVSGVGMFSIADANQLLDAMVSNISSGAKENSDDGVYQRTSITSTSSAPVVSLCNKSIASSDQMGGKSLSFPILGKAEVLGSSSANSACSLGNLTEDCYQSAGICKSQISLWVENGQSMHTNNISGSQSKKIEEKPNRKRARPGENPRPRPKDRQMIMDRVKELREIIPNGAKCSIDALLEKTIKHMFFLQSVTKHADNLKDIGEPKFINKEGGVLLKDKFEGGATWAFQVGCQSMTCPIIVEDLNPPRQMLVEMLCEQRGVFLEIADLIRGLGLTILKGVMEAHKDKIWARFAVEANRDVTRMEIFLSIVRMLESTVGWNMGPQGADNINVQHDNMYHQSCIAATGTSTQLP